MKKQFVQVLLGNPIDDPNELAFLHRLRHDLDQAGITVCILANVVDGNSGRQIDFFIATSSRAVHCELKTSIFPIQGGSNGPWQQVLPDGQRRPFKGNAYDQARAGTYVLSDAMRRLAHHDSSVPLAPGGKFFQLIDTVVCLYPTIPAGSHIQPHRFIQLLDYEGLLNHLVASAPPHAWKFEHWEALARSLGLNSLDERSDEEQKRETAQVVVDDYRRLFADAHLRGLHELVTVAANVEGTPVAGPDIVSIAVSQRNAIVVGPSGIGKTHLLEHAGLELVRMGHVVVWLHAGEYEGGRLKDFLEEAIAPFTLEDAVGLFRSVRDAGRVIVIALDGLNECPEPLRSRLVERLSALRQRAPFGFLVTAQSSPMLPQPVSGTEVYLSLPDSGERVNILRSYGAEEVAPLVEAFTTPYELSIAADCVSELNGSLSKSGLLDAYVRRRSGSMSIRDVLRRIAVMMDGQLRTSLPQADVEAFLQRSSGPAVPAGLVHDAFSSPLLAKRRGRIAFTHETLARFLAADEFVLRAEDGAALGRLLAQPNHADLREYAIALERDSDRLRDAVTTLADENMIVSAIRGELGDLAHDTVYSEAESLLSEAAFATMHDDIQIETGQLPFDARTCMSRVWSPWQMALLRSVGQCLFDGLFVPEVGLLVDRTDAKCGPLLLKLKESGDRTPITGFVSSVYALPWPREPSSLPASFVAQACRQRQMHSREGGVGAARMLTQGDGSPSWGRPYLASLLFNANNVEDAPLLPSLLQRAWQSAGYHLRLQSLDTATFAASALNAELKGEVVTVLESLETNHLMLNTALVDALAAYGAIKPTNTLEDIRQEIYAVLHRREDPDAWQAAVNLLGMQWENEDIFGPYFEAIQSLSREENLVLLLMAARVSRPGDLQTEWILEEIASVATFEDPEEREVFLRFASSIAPEQDSVQATVATHCTALRVCARILDVPPVQDETGLESNDLRAWRDIDRLIFKLERERLGLDTSDDDHGIWNLLLGELAHSAVDVLYSIHFAAVVEFGQDKSEHSRFLGAYRDEVRRLLEWGIVNRDRLTSYFRHVDTGERDRYMLRTLGEVGNASTAKLLRTFVHDPVIGEAAVAAVRLLDEDLR